MLRNTNKYFWHRYRGMVAVVIFEPSLLVYLLFYLFFSCIHSFILSLYHVTPFYPPTLYLRGWVLRAINLSKAFHGFRLWTWSWHHCHGSRMNLLWSRNWRSLPSFARVRGTVFVLGNPKHVTGNLELEVVPLFCRGEGGTMVHSQREGYDPRLGRAPRWLLSLVLSFIP